MPIKQTMSTKEAAEAEKRVNSTVEKLRQQHPDDSHEQFVKRLSKLAKEDETLMDDLMFSVVAGVIPEALR
jgi:hypothetical protein